MLDFGRLLELVKNRLNHLRWISTLVADAGFAEGQTLAKSRDQMFLELKSYRELKSIDSKETEKELAAVIASRQTSTREVFGDDWWTGYSFHHIAVEIVDMVIKNHLERLIREILVEHRAKSDKDLQEEWYVNWLDHPENFKPEWMLELKELFASITSEEFEWMRDWAKWILRLQAKLEIESAQATTYWNARSKAKAKKSKYIKYSEDDGLNLNRIEELSHMDGISLPEAAEKLGFDKKSYQSLSQRVRRHDARLQNKS